MTTKEWTEITEDIFEAHCLSNSAVKRTKFAGLKRNIAFLEP
jgi:epoxyqueuosine reductase